MNKLKTEGGRTGGVDTKLQELEAQLKKADLDDSPLEKELELLKRTAIRESETMKWKSLKEVSVNMSVSHIVLKSFPVWSKTRLTRHCF
jgi:hypothetical protein